MTYSRVVAAAKAAGLEVMGALHPAECGARQLDGGTLILLGTGAAFWPVFSASPEAQDCQPHPIDRWSTRVVDNLANTYLSKALYPFGGPPYAPFIDWALKSGRAFVSPTGMMVHDTVGLMISYRGALHFVKTLDIPVPQSVSPCETCIGQPCVPACPVGALGDKAPYDVAACHKYLDTVPGKDCMLHGCATRRACPFSQGAGRGHDQSTLHMKAFHPT